MKAGIDYEALSRHSIYFRRGFLGSRDGLSSRSLLTAPEGKAQIKPKRKKALILKTESTAP
jgi:hypothetical protein